MVETANVGYSGRLSRTGAYLGSSLGRLTGRSVTGIAGARQPANKVVNQSIDIAVGDLDIKQIIKWCVILAIIFLVLIFVVEFIRGILIGFEQVTCGIAHWGGGGQVCNPDAMNTEINSIYWGWEIEWNLWSLTYISLAVIVALLLYRWATWLFNKLIKIDVEIKKVEDWIFGRTWEGSAEREIDQDL